MFWKYCQDSNNLNFFHISRKSVDSYHSGKIDCSWDISTPPTTLTITENKSLLSFSIYDWQVLLMCLMHSSQAQLSNIIVINCFNCVKSLFQLCDWVEETSLFILLYSLYFHKNIVHYKYKISPLEWIL